MPTLPMHFYPHLKSCRQCLRIYVIFCCLETRYKAWIQSSSSFCRGFFRAYKIEVYFELSAVILVKFCVRRHISKAKIRENAPTIHGYTGRLYRTGNKSCWFGLNWAWQCNVLPSQIRLNILHMFNISSENGIYFTIQFLTY